MALVWMSVFSAGVNGFERFQRRMWETTRLTVSAYFTCAAPWCATDRVIRELHATTSDTAKISSADATVATWQWLGNQTGAFTRADAAPQELRAWRLAASFVSARK